MIMSERRRNVKMRQTVHTHELAVLEDRMKVDDQNTYLSQILDELQKTRRDLRNVERIVKDSLREMEKTRKCVQKIEANTNDEFIWHKKCDYPIDVYIRTSFVSIGDIDAVKQEFQCEFYMNVRWNEPSLNENQLTDDIDWDEYWDPSLYFMEVVKLDTFKSKKRFKLCQSPNAVTNVEQYFHIQGTFKEVTQAH